jgi:hypothetical protein
MTLPLPREPVFPASQCFPQSIVIASVTKYAQIRSS